MSEFYFAIIESLEFTVCLFAIISVLHITGKWELLWLESEVKVNFVLSVTGSSWFIIKPQFVRNTLSRLRVSYFYFFGSSKRNL